MKVKLTRSFQEKLKDQIEFIANDKPSAVRKFKNDLLDRIRDIPTMPYKNRRSVYFESENIRDLIFKGYVIVYRINEMENCIEVFGFIKHQDNPFS